MKLKSVLFVCLVLAQFTSFGQKKSTVGLSIGISLPVNDFASKDVEKVESGLATSGLSVTLNYDYQVIRNFGLSALVRLENNPFDTQTLSSGYNRTIGSTWSSIADDWKTLNFLFGGFYSFYANDKVGINLKGMAGVINIKQPALQSVTSYQGTNYYVNIGEKTTTAFSYLVGVNVKFHVTNSLTILGGVDYSASKPEFKDVVYSTNLGNTQPATGTIGYSTVNISTGLGYNF